MHNVTAHIGEAEVTSLVAVRQLPVIDAEKVQAGGVPAMNVDRVLEVANPNSSVAE